MITPRQIANLVLALALVCGGLSALGQQTPPPFSQIIVFGDSFSDTGNVRHRANAVSGGEVDYPSHAFNYSDGRFTNDNGTNPSSILYAGLWHEQLAQTFLSLPAASYSLGGGTSYAFAAATTKDGTRDVVVITTPSFGDLTITIDDMGKQMDDYLAVHTVDPSALYIVWGGINDLLTDFSDASVAATAARVTALVSRLAQAGARNIMVPNLPPLGNVPAFAGAEPTIRPLNAACANYRTELNADLAATLSALTPQGITPTVYRVNLWTNMIRLLSNPGNFGFTDVRSSSQGNASANADHFLFWDGLHFTTAGHFWTAKEANDALTAPPTAPAEALNISTRVFVGTGERVAIAGFIITGDVPKRILIRGIGPSLTASGVPNPLADPALTLFDGAGKLVRSNNNWRDSQADEITDTGLAPQNNLESAIVAALPAGNFTAVLTGNNGMTGNGLVEIYDLEPGTGATLANLSTRGFVGAGDDAMIAGVIIGQGESPIVVLRALGPTLANAGIANPLLDPTIELHNNNGALIGFNDNWKDSQMQAVNATVLAPTHEQEAAIVAPFLTPGNYTAVVRGKDNTTGVALVEAYRIP
jgi:phospholipase/lecithinase/hemolysin